MMPISAVGVPALVPMAADSLLVLIPRTSGQQHDLAAGVTGQDRLVSLGRPVQREGLHLEHQLAVLQQSGRLGQRRDLVALATGVTRAPASAAAKLAMETTWAGSVTSAVRSVMGV